MRKEKITYEVADKLIDKVKQYCAKNFRGTYEFFGCLFNHPPQNLEHFKDSYIDNIDLAIILARNNFGDEEIREFLKNINNEFWELVKKVYEYLWFEDVTTVIGESIAHDIYSLYNKVIKDNSLTIGEKVDILQKLEDALKELVDIIMDKSPPSSDTLRKYLANITSILNKYAKDNYFEGYINYYSRIPNEHGKRKALLALLDKISYILDDIYVDLTRYNSQGLTM